MTESHGNCSLAWIEGGGRRDRGDMRGGAAVIVEVDVKSDRGFQNQTGESCFIIAGNGGLARRWISAKVAG